MCARNSLDEFLLLCNQINVSNEGHTLSVFFLFYSNEIKKKGCRAFVPLLLILVMGRFARSILGGTRALKE